MHAQNLRAFNAVDTDGNWKLNATAGCPVLAPPSEAGEWRKPSFLFHLPCDPSLMLKVHLLDK